MASKKAPGGGGTFGYSWLLLNRGAMPRWLVCGTNLNFVVSCLLSKDELDFPPLPHAALYLDGADSCEFAEVVFGVNVFLYTARMVWV